MQLTRFGRTGMSVSHLCLGTSTLRKQTDEEESDRILDAAADAGINFLYTANFYPIGAAQAQPGKGRHALRGSRRTTGPLASRRIHASENYRNWLGDFISRDFFRMVCCYSARLSP
ncbi:MAG: aldo/keto reductase [Candidatus Afipia apatlaquensis]|uniref:Aldo/keto reductase n=1 Tax=Candidatus Afipia apatlaquensis TaxID=2712852 RepID=A0A7C9VNE4_9BRAD|nr:aldo/keto reductase [Candidatus Afipia apatlaquensis]